jgi:hypothetical protein
MELELVNRNSLLALAPKEPADDTSSVWWVTLKILRKMGFSCGEMGKGIAIFVRGDGVIIRDNDARIESFVYDARNVRVFARGQSDSLGSYHNGLAFSLELYSDRRSYSPMYGFMSADPYELAKNYLFTLQDLARESGIAALRGTNLTLKSGDSEQRSLEQTPGSAEAAERS